MIRQCFDSLQVSNATTNNISVLSIRLVLLAKETGIPVETVSNVTNRNNILCTCRQGSLSSIICRGKSSALGPIHTQPLTEIKL